MTWLWFVVAGLATFRLAVLLSEDTGPWNIFTRLRAALKREAKTNAPLRKSKIHEGITCIRCDSVWVAAPIAVLTMLRPHLPIWIVLAFDGFLLWMALSAVAILVNRAWPKA